MKRLFVFDGYSPHFSLFHAAQTPIKKFRMLLETLIASAAGYIVKGIQESKAGKTAADELSVAIWEWIRPVFLKDDPKTLEKIEKTAPAQVQPLVELAIEKKADDRNFLETLQKMVQEADARQGAATGNLSITGDDNIAVKDVSHSTITINTPPR
jgi:hypothetical protein